MAKYYAIHTKTGNVIKPGRETWTEASIRVAELVSQLRVLDPDMTVSDFEVNLLTQEGLDEYEAGRRQS